MGTIEDRRLAEQTRRTSRLYRRLTRGVALAVAVAVFMGTRLCGGSTPLALALAGVASLTAWLVTVVAFMGWLFSELD